MSDESPGAASPGIASATRTGTWPSTATISPSRTMHFPSRTPRRRAPSRCRGSGRGARTVAREDPLLQRDRVLRGTSGNGAVRRRNGGRAHAVRQRAGEGPGQGNRPAGSRARGAHHRADRRGLRPVAHAGERPARGACLCPVPRKDRGAGAGHEARQRALPPRRAEDPLPLHRGEQGRLPRSREGPRHGLQDAHRAAPDRGSRRGARGRRGGHLRPGAVLQRDHRQAEARFHQDGQGAEPHPQLDEDLRALRHGCSAAFRTSSTCTRRPARSFPPWEHGCSSKGRSSA